MALLDRLPRNLFTARGWGMLASGAAALGAAAIMGRRDLLGLAILLLVLPLVSLAGIRLAKPRFQVYREFNPSPVETAAPTTVRLAVSRKDAGSARATMEEHLPARFGESPAFHFPARSATGGTSRYEYHLRSRQRGQFRIGPVMAEFTDAFGLSMHRHAIDDGDLLTVTPAAVVLPATGLAGARGNDGVTATRIRANPSDDDVMTREYRLGDPMRRVHWAATARHGDLMVRQEESVTTPEATVIFDIRSLAHSPGNGPAPTGRGRRDGNAILTTETFEWAVVAVMSIAAHLTERKYGLRLLDARGEPAFLTSPSAPEPEVEDYTGSSGLQSIAESLAAIGLAGGGHRGPAESAAPPFDDHLMDKLSGHRMRGPLIAVLGTISAEEAVSLAPAAGFGTNAFALIVAEKPGEYAGVLETLRRGGWRAAAVAPATPVGNAWSGFDEDVVALAPSPTARQRNGVLQ